MLLGTVMEVVEDTPGKDIRRSGTVSFNVLGKIIGKVSITFLYFCTSQWLQRQPTAPHDISFMSSASPSSSVTLVSCSFRASAGSSPCSFLSGLKHLLCCFLWPFGGSRFSLSINGSSGLKPRVVEVSYR